MRRACHLLLLCACAGSPPDEADTDVLVEPVRFAFPLADPAEIGEVVGVDHDPADHSDSVIGRAICTDYLGRSFPSCYDGHDGSDFILEGGFAAMDAGSLAVIAAAPGVVVDTRDGQYDRCHATITGDIDCDGHEPPVANMVIVEHQGGVRSLYWHLKQGSVAVAVGDEVPRGRQLGLVGSSGVSSTPHLHFEVNLADGTVVDPFVDPTGSEPSWWCDQHGDGRLPGGCAD
ncbi:MAG: M23 family metallopeptidase [Alphaproteobacteria bacterium]|nr:M23 family metallopeptidase [Alphaproteobacteria bacterium]